jgi:hypothetical protein
MQYPHTSSIKHVLLKVLTAWNSGGACNPSYLGAEAGGFCEPRSLRTA